MFASETGKMKEELYMCVYTVMDDLFTSKETQCFYLSIFDFVENFFKFDAIQARIELGVTVTSAPQFYCGRTVITNENGVFYK